VRAKDGQSQVHSGKCNAERDCVRGWSFLDGGTRGYDLRSRLMPGAAPKIRSPSLPRGFTIISGGQTGVDRAALDWAIANGIPHGGWCPKYRLAEDGCIPVKYKLKEMDGTTYADRTEQNVRDSDGTLIISMDARLVGGSKLTAEFARKHRKPLLHVSKADLFPWALVAEFIRENKIRRLNVGGPRASTEPHVSRFVTTLLDAALIHLRAAK
jgi:hypothetical protein